MAIIIRPLANGRNRYEVRIHRSRNQKPRCTRFDTMEEAQTQEREWKRLEAKGKWTSNVDLKWAQHFFLYGSR